MQHVRHWVVWHWWQLEPWPGNLSLVWISPCLDAAGRFSAKNTRRKETFFGYVQQSETKWTHTNTHNNNNEVLLTSLQPWSFFPASYSGVIVWGKKHLVLMSSYSALYDCCITTHRNFNEATRRFLKSSSTEKNLKRRPFRTEAYLALHFLNFLTVEHVEIFVAAEVVALHLLVILLFVICLKKKKSVSKTECVTFKRGLFEWSGQENTKSCMYLYSHKNIFTFVFSFTHNNLDSKVVDLLWVCKIYNAISFNNSPEHDSTQGFNALTGQKKKEKIRLALLRWNVLIKEKYLQSDTKVLLQTLHSLIWS